MKGNFQLDPESIVDRCEANGARPVPSLAESVTRGAIGFTLVSVAGFAPWALAGRALHRVVGEVGMYAACAVVFVGLSGVLLHRLIIGPGSLRRFYALFSVAFLTYAVCWTVAWIGLRGQVGGIIGLLLGTMAMAWILVRAFDAGNALIAVALQLFVLNAIGYFGGGWVAAAVARQAPVEWFGIALDRSGMRAVAMLMWGVCYGLGLGTGLGLAFYQCQTRVRALLASR